MMIAIAALLAAPARAQNWTQYRLGGTTYYSGNTPDEKAWTGNSYRICRTTFCEFDGPHGQPKRRSSYQLGGTVCTNCN
jgi:hypothetical protein